MNLYDLITQYDWDNATYQEIAEIYKTVDRLENDGMFTDSIAILALYALLKEKGQR